MLYVIGFRVHSRSAKSHKQRRLWRAFKRGSIKIFYKRLILQTQYRIYNFSCASFYSCLTFDYNEDDMMLANVADVK